MNKSPGDYDEECVPGYDRSRPALPPSAGMYCRRCDAKHHRAYCPDCGLKLIPADLIPPELEPYRRALQHIAYEPLTDDPEASAVICLEEATRIAREALAGPTK